MESYPSMNVIQIENWALEIINRVEANQPIEDSRVELKSTWLDSNERVARRIAGHANAARGENILWLIGVDEKKGVIGVDSSTDLAIWYSTVQKCFNEVSPRLTDLNIYRNDATVVALLFETDRAPFIVKNPAYGKTKGDSVEFEIPWREGTRIRTASRSDIILLLSPLELLPDIEIYSKNLSATIGGIDSLGNDIPDRFDLHLELYIVPKNGTDLIIPFHRCKAWYTIGHAVSQFPFDTIRISPGGGSNYNSSDTIFPSNLIPSTLNHKYTTNEILIEKAGMVKFIASSRPPSISSEFKKDVYVEIHLFPATATRPKVLTMIIPYPEEKKVRHDLRL